MNKKIASEIAVGVILLLAIIIGGIFWLQNEESVISDQQSVIGDKKTQQPVQKDCTQERSDISQTGLNYDYEFAECSKNDDKIAVESPKNKLDNEKKPEVFIDETSNCRTYRYDKDDEYGTGYPISFPNVSANKIANWRTYKNEQYGFEVKYPSSWIHTEENFSSNINSVLQLTLMNNKVPGIEIDANSVSIFVYENVKQLPSGTGNVNAETLEEYLNEEFDIIDFKKMIINDYDAYVAVGGGYSLYLSIFLEKNGVIYEIGLSELNFEKCELSDIKNQILSTFKFTN